MFFGDKEEVLDQISLRSEQHKAKVHFAFLDEKLKCEIIAYEDAASLEFVSALVHIGELSNTCASLCTC